MNDSGYHPTRILPPWIACEKDKSTATQTFFRKPAGSQPARTLPRRHVVRRRRLRFPAKSVPGASSRPLTASPAGRLPRRLTATPRGADLPGRSPRGQPQPNARSACGKTRLAPASRRAVHRTGAVHRRPTTTQHRPRPLPTPDLAGTVMIKGCASPGRALAAIDLATRRPTCPFEAGRPQPGLSSTSRARSARRRQFSSAGPPGSPLQGWGARLSPRRPQPACATATTWSGTANVPPGGPAATPRPCRPDAHRRRRRC